MTKRLLSILLALCLVLTLLPGTAWAVDYPTSGTCGENVTWTYDDSTKTMTISGSGEIDSFRDNKGHLVYEMSENVENVKFSGDFTSIQDYAFSNFSDLKEIDIPDSVIRLGYSVFSGCSKLAKIIVPSGVKEIGIGHSGAFNNCPMLTSAGPIGSGSNIEFGWEKEIPSLAFADCRYLTKITIPDTITNIGYYAFAGCAAMTSISIPADVIRINYDSAFYGCTSLENISVDPKNKIYSSQDGMLFDKEQITLYVCPGKKNKCTIPKTVEKVESSAFNGCSNLTELIIPDNVTNCGSLYLSGCTSLNKITLSGNVKHWYKISASDSLTTAIINEGTTSLSGTFSGASKLATVYLPASLEVIYDGTFANCSNLSTIYFAGTEAQWNTLKIGYNNQEIGLANVIYNTPVPAPSEVPSTPDTPNTPDTPDTPNTPSTPTIPVQLTATVTSGGLGKKLSIQTQGGHWLTIQTRRAGSISISSIQAPVTSSGVATVSFSAPSGSVVQIWETAEEMQFSNGIPTTTIIGTVVKTL